MRQSPLKIAMITPQWLKTKGGPTTYVSNLVTELRRAGHEVYVLTSEEGEGAVQLPGGLFGRLSYTFRHLTTLKPNIVHIHGRVGYIAPAWLYKIFCNHGVKLIITFYTMPSVHCFLNFAPPVRDGYAGFRGLLAKLMLRRCDALTSLSQSIITDLNRYCRMDIHDYTVIPSASFPLNVDVNTLKSIKDGHTLHNSWPVLSTIGVMGWDWKVAGHQICIEAVDLLRRKFPNIRLLIAGDGMFRSYLENIVHQRKIEGFITFLGNVDFIPELLELSDIYVHMGLNEGSPLAVVEAMHAGLPIIAANRGGIPEILENDVTGLLIEPNAERLAQTVERLVENKREAERLAQNAFEYATADLSWEIIAKRYLAVYQGSNSS